MAQIIQIYPTRDAPEPALYLPAEILNTAKRFHSWVYWRACHEARRGERVALLCLRDIAEARPTERLACAAGGTLAGMGLDWTLMRGIQP